MLFFFVSFVSIRGKQSWYEILYFLPLKIKMFLFCRCMNEESRILDFLMLNSGKVYVFTH